MKQLKYRENFTKYKLWRSTLPYNVIDIDQVEIRNDKPAAIIETTAFKYKNAIRKNFDIVLHRAKYQLEIQKIFADALHIPLFLIIHTDDPNYFFVYNYNTAVKHEFNELEYIDFISKIGEKEFLYDWM